MLPNCEETLTQKREFSVRSPFSFRDRPRAHTCRHASVCRVCCRCDAKENMSFLLSSLYSSLLLSTPSASSLLFFAVCMHAHTPRDRETCLRFANKIAHVDLRSNTRAYVPSFLTFFFFVRFYQRIHTHVSYTTMMMLMLILHISLNSREPLHSFHSVCVCVFE